MRYYGKYEKSSKYECSPEVASAKQPKAKSVLLQAYFTGLLCLVLSVTMFFGTTYAWFTSEVTNAANEIYVGRLEVGLYKVVDSEADKDLSEEGNKLFDSTIWKPDDTAFATIKVKNEGDLAFKYELSFILADESAASMNQAAQYFDVWVYNGTVTDASFENITVENGWTKAGSLRELLDAAAKKTVLTGEKGTALMEKEDTYTIALHMQGDAPSDVMGQKITFNVKLVAYQKVYEPEQNGE